MASVTGDFGAQGSQASGSAGSVVQGVADQAVKAGQAAKEKVTQQAMERAESGKGAIIKVLDEVASSLEEAARANSSQLPRRLFEQAAGYVRSTGETLERGSTEDLLYQARSQLRERPAIAVAGLFAVGFLAGRLLKL